MPCCATHPQRATPAAAALPSTCASRSKDMAVLLDERVEERLSDRLAVQLGHGPVLQHGTRRCSVPNRSQHGPRRCSIPNRSQQPYVGSVHGVPQRRRPQVEGVAHAEGATLGRPQGIRTHRVEVDVGCLLARALVIDQRVAHVGDELHPRLLVRVGLGAVLWGSTHIILCLLPLGLHPRCPAHHIRSRRVGMPPLGFAHRMPCLSRRRTLGSALGNEQRPCDVGQGMRQVVDLLLMGEAGPLEQRDFLGKGLVLTLGTGPFGLQVRHFEVDV
mmetsp:Transcript_29640/g.74545  ORF Transcript_29640/g.74545 Transcript_29640/m.74545 type:complete len:273 (-) Transcript_29640:592-1410(-)